MTCTQDIKVFADICDCTKQIEDMGALYKGSKIRIMPDCHAGKGSVIGFTCQLDDITQAKPCTIGVDIGCGVSVAKLEVYPEDLGEFDQMVHSKVPTAHRMHHSPVKDARELLESLRCREHIDVDKAMRQVGTLGSGNHFIELTENGLLIVHTGSRYLGVQVCDYYDSLYGTSEWRGADYIHDMDLCQRYAELNRKTICELLGARIEFESVHNYIDIENSIIRKGAISAQDGQRVIIPLNMRDGCILGVGKGNPDYNYSAPHGAGRLMSRTKAKSSISLESFRDTMAGIYSTCVTELTLDESPFAYKSFGDISKHLEPSVNIERVVKPVYNFKGV